MPGTNETFWIMQYVLLPSFISVAVCNANLHGNDLQIVLLCDDEVEANCTEIVYQALPIETSIFWQTVNISGHVLKDHDDFAANLDALDQQVTKNNNTALLIGFGGDDIVNVITCVAEHYSVPAVTYITSHHRKSIYESSSVKINPDHAGIGHALLTIIGPTMSKNTFVICEENLMADGFLDVLEGADSDIRIERNRQVLVSNEDSDFDLELKLRYIHDSGFRIIVVHSHPNMLHRLIEVAKSLSYIDLGYAWIVTEEALPNDFLDVNVDVPYPNGLLAIQGHEEGQLQGLIEDTVEAYRQVVTNSTQDSTISDVTLAIQNLLVDLHYSQTVLSGLRSAPTLFDDTGRRKNMKFRLLNYVHDKTVSEWRAVGSIQGDQINLNTVVWPGHSIFGPAGLAREHYTIVTRQAEPFMYIWGPIMTASECAGAVQCLRVFSYDPLEIRETVENFRNNVEYPNVTYEVHCCEGVVVDILSHLSSELEFDFLLYFQNDSNFGHMYNRSWTGMIGDVVNGPADIMAGAVSVTSDRLKGVAFTEPFYYSSFNMISSSTEKYYSLLAFTKPFDTQVWIMIVLSANVTAVVTSLFEWNSPFGLNPWGKRRKRNYTFGSALTMVYSIWFGHTVSTKSPKSWPSKFVQNIWAVMSIFILASYTANLAAFLAGNTYEDMTYSILDAKLTSKKVGVVKTSAAEEYTKAINSDLHARFSKYYVSGVNEGIEKIRTKELDLYMDDSPILEYALSRYDDNCSMKYAAHSFGENAYAFGVRADSNIKARFDPFILNYMELGLTEDLRWRYMGKGRQCENKRMDNSDLQFGLPHTGGLFVMLLVAVGLSFIVLIIEHVLYFCILPRLRNKPTNSLWKSRKVEYVSQRIYRAIHSEKVTPTTQVMVTKVKQKKFELQSKLRKQLNSGSSSSLTSYRSVVARLPGFTHMEAFHPDYERSMSFPSRNSVYTISGNVSETIHEEDIVFDDLYLTVNMDEALLERDQYKAHSAHTNPAFNIDDIDLEMADPDQLARNGIKARRSQSDRLQRGGNIRTISKRKVPKPLKSKGRTRHSDSDITYMTSDKRYETWPSPKQRKRSLKRLKNNQQNVSFTTSDKLYPKMGSRIVNEIQPTSTRKHSTISLDCYPEKNSNMGMKDNRVKSNLRHHAMAYRRGPSFSVDESAVEALTKEDLLVLWKRSEIELQTKLNRIIHQNSHLRRLVNIVEENSAIGQVNSNIDSTTDDRHSSPNSNVFVSTQL